MSAIDKFDECVAAIEALCAVVMILNLAARVQILSGG